MTPICRCSAYNWPHRPGSGLCDGKTDLNPPPEFLVRKITRILKQHNGICLAELSTGEFAVGVSYTVGEILTKPSPYADFAITKLKSIAEKVFSERSQ